MSRSLPDRPGAYINKVATNTGWMVMTVDVVDGCALTRNLPSREGRCCVSFRADHHADVISHADAAVFFKLSDRAVRYSRTSPPRLQR